MDVVQVPQEYLGEQIETRGGTDIMLVIEKKLTSMDLDDGHNRLSMPQLQVKNSFLEGEEESRMANGGIPVKVLEPCGKESDMILKIWKMNSTSTYVLIAGLNGVSWNKVKGREENIELGIFEHGNVTRVWSFRVDGQLWLAFDN